MSLSQKSRTRLRTVAVLGLGVAVLAGCGSARPGVAFDVAGSTTSLSQVDNMSLALCEALRPQLAAQQDVRPMSQVRTFATMLMINGEVARKIGAENDLKPSPEYGAAVDYWEQQAGSVDEGLREDFVAINTMGMLDTDYRAQLGRRILAEQGNTEPTDEEATAAGSQVFDEWFASHDIDVDPRFGMQVVDGIFTPDDGALSVPVSDLAVSRANLEDVSYVSSLPDDQVCG